MARTNLLQIPTMPPLLAHFNSNNNSNSNPNLNICQNDIINQHNDWNNNNINVNNNINHLDMQSYTY